MSSRYFRCDWAHGHGEEPVRIFYEVSPDGRVILTIQGKTVQCQAVESGATAPPWCTSPLLKLRGSNGHPVFSPDGSRIAFVSDRGDHSQLNEQDRRQVRGQRNRQGDQAADIR